MAKYRKKPVIIEALTFNELVEYGIKQSAYIVHGLPWSFELNGRNITHDNQTGEDRYIINTLEGDMVMSQEDILIIGVEGEPYPCKLDIFEKTYEKVED